MPTYTPAPLDTTNIKLPPTFTGLLEKVAENIHDVWAQQRMNDGWTHGTARDDKKKKHPCLVPYSDLPEHEKAYDRKIASETVKVILQLGYTLVPPS